MPNNSFKPNLLRSTNNMAGKACHVVASATQVGLTQALGLTGHSLARMETETLIAALDKHDQLLRCVAAGRLSVVDFLAQYDNFYWAYALDGHEPEPGAAALAALSNRIEPHRRVAEEVLAVLTDDPSASQPAFISAGRIGPTEAVDRLRLIAKALPAGGA